MAKFFSDREIRAVAIFLPLAGLLITALVLVRPSADPEAARRAEAAMETRRDSVVLRHFDPNTATLDELLALGRRAVCDVPGVLVLGVRTADGSAVFRLWVREEEREVTVAL